MTKKMATTTLVFAVIGLASASALAQTKTKTAPSREQRSCEGNRGTWRNNACQCGEYGMGFVSCPDSRGGFCPSYEPPTGNTVRIMLVTSRSRGGCEAVGGPLDCSGINRTSDTLAMGTACLEQKRALTRTRVVEAVRDRDVDPAHLPTQGDDVFTRQDCLLLKVPSGDHFDECVWDPAGFCNCEQYPEATQAVRARPRYDRQCMGSGIAEENRALCDRCVNSSGVFSERQECECNPRVVECTQEGASWSCAMTLGVPTDRDRYRCEVTRNPARQTQAIARREAEGIVRERVATLQHTRAVAQLLEQVRTVTAQTCADVHLPDGSRPPQEVCAEVGGWMSRDGKCGFCDRVRVAAAPAEEEEEEEEEAAAAPAAQPAAPAAAPAPAATPAPAGATVPAVTGEFEEPGEEEDEEEEGEVEVTVERPTAPTPAATTPAPAASPSSPAPSNPVPAPPATGGHEVEAPAPATRPVAAPTPETPRERCIHDPLTGEWCNPYEHFSCENVQHCLPPWPFQVMVLGGVAAHDLSGLQVASALAGLSLRFHTRSRVGLFLEGTYGYAGVHRGRGFNSVAGAGGAVIRLDRQGEHAALAGIAVGALGFRGNMDSEASYVAAWLGYSVVVVGGQYVELRTEPRLGIYYRLTGDPNAKGSRVLVPTVMAALAF